ncbi:MAG: hypothetical protein V3W14_08300 [Candidatus Neomarinimicrobiota bacterium]
MSISGRYANSEGTGERDAGYPDSLAIDNVIYSEDNQSQTLNLSLIAQRLKYTQTSKGLYLVWGVGPIIGFDYASWDDKMDIDNDVEPSNDYLYSHREIKNWAVALGVSGTIGVEWFLRPGMSLTAAYFSALKVQYKSNFIKHAYARSNITSYRSTDTPGIIITTSSQAKLGLSVYF